MSVCWLKIKTLLKHC